MPSSPSQRTPRTTWGNGLPTMPTAAYLVAEGISPTTGPGREGKRKTLRCLLSLRVAYGCAMKCGGGPTQPTYHHHSITAQHQCAQVRDNLICFAQGNFVTLGVRLPIQPSAVGDRSLMWPYHITGTPGCSTPKADTSTPWSNDRSRAQRSASIH